PSLLLGLVGVYAHDQNPRERLEVEYDARLEFGLALDQIKLVETNKPVRELGREQADGGELRPGQVEVEAVSFGHNLLDANLHGVARLGLADVNRPGDRMWSSAGIGQAKPDDFFHRRTGLDLIEGVHQRLNRNSVTGVHGELGCFVRIEPTP